VGLRTAEVVGLRVWDVDFMRGVVRPVQQGSGEPLKSETSRSPLPIPKELALQLSAAVPRWGGDYVVTDGHRSAGLDVGDRAGHPLGPAEGRRAARGVPLPRPPGTNSRRC
jgi:hypothetical protein